MKKKAIYIFAVAFMFYLAYQVLSMTVSPVMTEQAEEYTAHESIQMDGVIVRNETVIYNDKGGVINYTVNNGERVKKGSQVATIYSSEEDVEKQMELEDVENTLSNLQQALSPDGLAIRDVTAIDNKISSMISETIYGVSRGDISGLRDKKNEADVMLAVKQVENGQTDELNQRIAALQQRQSELQSSVANKVTDITVEEAGYFMSSLDGYEERFKTDMLDNLNVADAQTMLSMEKQEVNTENSRVVGKVIEDFNWYFVGVIDAESAKKLSIDKKVSLDFPFLSDTTMDATVHHISSPSGDKVAVVFECRVVNDTIRNMRQAEGEVVLNSYSGIKVSKEACRVVDGKTGVYVLKGRVCRFKEIEVLYEDDEIVVAKKLDPVQDTDCLQTTDKVIVKGKDLYDGKVIN